jgi:predicted AAA+ superfamily ATPase
MEDSVASAYGLLQKAVSLLVYQSVLETEIGQAFLQLLRQLCQIESDAGASSLECLRAYGAWFKLLADRNQSWQDYLLTAILRDDNPFSRQVQGDSISKRPISEAAISEVAMQSFSTGLSPALIAAVRQDLRILQVLYQCDGEQLSAWVQAIAHLPEPPVSWNSTTQVQDKLKAKFASLSDWADSLDLLSYHYQTQGTGLVAEYRAFRWQAGELVGIAHPDPVQVSNLVGYELQREVLLKNTEFLLRGYAALHVLLYGSRGSGKSSLVKGLLHQYGDRGLRLIEVAKSDLQALPAIANQLRSLPQKFIIFVDDLSFEEEEADFKALKVVLEGNLTARPQNVVVYATSNRRHLIREFFGDRPRPKDGDEVHAWDTVQEKLSFSDRFGLTLTFEPPNQETYLQIIHHLAQQAGISLAPDDLEFRALQWATRHNGRSGRTARQFIDFLQAELSIPWGSSYEGSSRQPM